MHQNVPPLARPNLFICLSGVENETTILFSLSNPSSLDFASKWILTDP